MLIRELFFFFSCLNLTVLMLIIFMGACWYGWSKEKLDEINKYLDLNFPDLMRCMGDANSIWTLSPWSWFDEILPHLRVATIAVMIVHRFCFWNKCKLSKPLCYTNRSSGINYINIHISGCIFIEIILRNLRHAFVFDLLSKVCFTVLYGEEWKGRW